MHGQQQKIGMMDATMAAKIMYEGADARYIERESSRV